MSANKNLIKIQQSKVNELEKLATRAMELKKHTVIIKSEDDAASQYSRAGTRQTVDVKIIEAISNITEDTMLSTVQNKVLLAIRRAICLSTVISDMHKKVIGYEALAIKRAQGITSERETTEIKKMERALTTIGIHSLCSYLIFSLADIKTSNPKESLEYPIDFSHSELGFTGVLYSIYKNIIENTTSDDELVNVLIDLAEKTSALAAHAAQEAEYIGNFANTTYALEGEDFKLDGFEPVSLLKKANKEMKRVMPRDVVGNSVAKYELTKLAKVMMCYDFVAKKNPFQELGGFSFAFMGDGNPGTGKTTLIQMFCTLLSDMCSKVGYDFYYENFGVDQVSEFQGKSGQNARAFINNVLNPNVISFGTIDDIDQVAGKRNDSKSSGGQQEITAVLMDALAGANTVVRGNAVIGMFSNYPENVDDALRQRAGGRYNIDGPQTKEDFGDILTILLGKMMNIEQGDRIPFETQDIKKAAQSGYEKHNLPENEDLLKAYNETLKEFGCDKLDTVDKIQTYWYNIKNKVDDRFTGRACQNIANSALKRAMDIDLPDEWFAGDNTLFIDKPYEEKLDIIKGLISGVYPEILIQETNKYQDSEMRYSGKSDDVAINDRVRQFTIDEKAQAIYRDNLKNNQ